MHNTCICGHRDNRHADRDDGTILGQWGVGECEFCGCKSFECVDCKNGKEQMK